MIAIQEADSKTERFCYIDDFINVHKICCEKARCNKVYNNEITWRI